MSDVPRDLASLTLAEFTSHLGERFQLLAAGAALELELVSADALGDRRQAGGRLPFSLVFRGPRAHALPQRIHRLESAQLGVLEVFLVPIEPDAGRSALRGRLLLIARRGTPLELQVEALLADRCEPEAPIEPKRRVRALHVDSNR